MATGFCKKVPPTSVSPTFKLTLPSDEAAANLGQFLNTDFELRETNTELTWRVSISKRRNKDKYEYLLMGWRVVCEQLDVRCGDFLEFLVFSNHLEFTLSRTQQHGANDILMNSNSQGFQDKSNSSSDEMHMAAMAIARPTLQSTAAEDSDKAQQVVPTNSMAADASPSSMRDHLLDLVMDLDVESIDEEGLSIPSSQNMETLPMMEEPPTQEASNQWLGSSSDLSFMDFPEKRESPIRALSKKRKLEPETPARPWHKLYNRNGKLPRSVSFHSDLGVQESNTSDRFGFDPDMYRSSMRLNQFRASDVETDRLRNALRGEQERAARAEMRNAKLIRVMSGAESVLERQTSRGLSRVGAIFTAANRLISKDMAQHMGLSAAHKLGSCQLELKQLANEVLDALWQLRGLTKQKDVPSGYVAPHTLPSHRNSWRQSPCYGLAQNQAGAH